MGETSLKHFCIYWFYRARSLEEDGTSGLFTYIFDDWDKVCADVALVHGCPQNCMPNPVKDLLEVYEDMVEVLLVLAIFLT